MCRRLVGINILGILLLACSVAAFADGCFKVRWVDDGDTIVLADGTRVRYIGINAPEIAHADRAAEPFGYAAAKFNKSMVMKKMVRLEFDSERLDRYGRTLAYVFLSDGQMINIEMLKQGLAYFMPRKPNIKYTGRLLAAQQGAMSSGKGIWRNWKEKKQGYIGNQRSQRFHRLNCSFGKKTGKRNRVLLTNRWEAFWLGYAPCKRCIP